MATGAQDVNAAYNEGIAQISKILGSMESTQEQIDTATQSLNDLTAMMLAHTVNTIQGQTALLAGLIVELNQVTSTIHTTPRDLAIAEQLKKTLGNATDLYEKAKKGLLG